MKTLYKIFTLMVVVFSYATTLTAQTIITPQTNTGSYAMTSGYDWQYDDDYGDYLPKYYVLNVSPNTPIKINYNLYTYDTFDIYTYDNGVSKSYVSTYYPITNQSVTVSSSTGKIYINVYYGWNTIESGPVFDFNYAVDPTYTISQNSQYTTGKLGIGVFPIEKLEVEGNARINNKLTVGLSNMVTHANLSVYGNNNSTVNYGIYNILSRSTTSPVYGNYTYTSNNSGNVYGIYSSVSGPTGKKWAGYFSGGDVEVVEGNLFLNSENSVISIKDDNLGIVKKHGQSSVWAVGSNYAHRFGKWSTPTLKGNIGSGTFTEQMRIDGTGKVGIGTTTPSKKLDVVGDALVSGSLFTSEIHFLVDGNENSDPYTLRKVHESGNVSHLDLNLNDDADESFRIYGNSCVGYNCGTYSGNLYHSFDASGNAYHAGNVKIGTSATNPNTELLTVFGVIHAKEIKVDLTGALADFVFKPTYKLMPLHEVEQFVKTNSHLPEIPSAAEVSKNGMNMGEMQNKMLQKIEELTLYVIEQQKRIEQLEKSQK